MTDFQLLYSYVFFEASIMTKERFIVFFLNEMHAIQTKVRHVRGECAGHPVSSFINMLSEINIASEIFKILHAVSSVDTLNLKRMEHEQNNHMLANTAQA